MRRARRLAAFASLLPLAGACVPRHMQGLPDPAGARRFEIMDVRDSTFRFVLDGARWVRDGAQGIAVDPARRDALVARFVVRGRVADTATALITGQTSRVATTHVALLDRAPTSTLGQRSFWLGALAGALIGVSAALSAR